ncbi:putative E3 ubiquitin-protein ligase HIP1 [Canna indica]|uniref:RING-type E3 ubiquitin transferase n=1 Tax=Canna indica TaxID=4628 RepID=A0AAQ3QNV9_9LILI|nr:putative E3 ubiquitin-protein ligase HIP1 [Canna indica]
MDECVGKASARDHSLSRRESNNIVFKDCNQEDRNIQNFSRLGCSSSRVSSRGFQNGTPEKPQNARASFRSMSGKAVAGSSSKQFSISSRQRKSLQEHHNQTFLQEPIVKDSICAQKIDSSINEQVPTDNVCTDGRRGRKGVSQSIPKMNKSLKSSAFKEISTDMTKPSSSCDIASSSKAHKQINKQLVSGDRGASSSSIIPHSTSASRKFTYAAKSFSQGLGTTVGGQRCGLKGISCTSVSGGLPSGCSSSNLISEKRIDMATKGPSNEESYAATKRGSNTSFTTGYSGTSQTETSAPNIPIPGQIKHEPVSRRTRNRLTIRDGAVSVRTQWNFPNGSRMMTSTEGSGGTIPPARRENSSEAFSINLPHTFNNSSGRPSSNTRIARNRAGPQDRSIQTTHVSLGDHHGHRHFDVEGVAEVLLALERIEQDEEITYEQLLVLESNLLFGALRFHDQHRGMRMDIDNMSYEELLALEERMGTVSTALTEEQLSKCLKISTYTSAYLDSGITVHDNDDVKCSICQEEYIVGDAVGTLPCEHRYHVACVRQWLCQKNWCPICKSSALPSQKTT